MTGERGIKPLIAQRKNDRIVRIVQMFFIWHINLKNHIDNTIFCEYSIVTTIY